MNLIIPMAGKSTRLYPHSLNKPKVFLNIAGKSVLERIIRNILDLGVNITNIGLIVNDIFIPKDLIKYYENLSKAKIYLFKQKQCNGNASAINCAQDLLWGPTIIVYSDTMFFHEDLKIETSDSDGIIYVSTVDDPSKYGIMTIGENGFVNNFIEKPKTNINSNITSIGLFYFKNGNIVRRALEYVLMYGNTVNGEYLFTDCILWMIKNNYQLSISYVKEWLDCGNIEAFLNVNKNILNKEYSINSTYYYLENNVIIPPVYLGKNIEIHNNIIGPYVSIEDNTKINNSIIKDSLIYNNSIISNRILEHSFIGNNVKIDSKFCRVNMGDYACIQNE